MSESVGTSVAAASTTTDGGQEQIPYQQMLNNIIKKGVFEFEYIEGPRAGEKVNLERHKITVAKMIELEKIRGEYAAIVMRSNDETDRSAMDNRLKASDLLSKIYSKCAEYYFHIKYEDFILMDWDTAKINLDAATNISISGRPN